MAAKKTKKPSFEEGIREIEAITAQLSEGGLPLEESLQAYEKGVALVRALEEELESCRKRIEQIDPAFHRRFQYHLDLKSPPPGARAR